MNPIHVLNFEITLVDHCIVSENNSTVGAHRSVDYLPGALFLGTAAKALYNKDDIDSWDLFHSGHVRFNDALPSLNSQTLKPVPLALHHYKGESHFNNENKQRYLRDDLFNPNLLTPEPGRQPKQLRGGYVGEDGLFLSPKRTATMKTAIDPSNGIAADQQLYGYQAIAKGQRYHLEVHCDAHISQQQQEQISKALSGTHYLGRSRTAQFGKVTIQPQKTSELPQQAPETTAITLWLLSDLALVDKTGQTCLHPDSALEGTFPAHWTWNGEKSFIRTRRYSPYNGKRQCHDMERVVLSRGSVLHFDSEQNLTAEELHKINQGMGLYREFGLGRVCINHSFTTKPNFAPTQPKKSLPNHNGKQTKTITSPLINALRRRASTGTERAANSETASEIFQKLCTNLEAARHWNGIAPGSPMETAPTNSQWGLLRELAAQHRHQGSALKDALCKKENSLLNSGSWSVEVNPQETLGDRLKQLLNTVGNKDSLPDVVSQIANLGLTDRWKRIVNGGNPL